MQNSKILLMVLAIVWGLFLIWEIDLQKNPLMQSNTMLRIDLLLLPVLLITTLYIVYAIKKQRNKKR